MNRGGGTRLPCSNAAIVDAEYPVRDPNSARSSPARSRNRFSCRPNTRRMPEPGSGDPEVSVSPSEPMSAATVPSGSRTSSLTRPLTSTARTARCPR
jgi:hypothetical protein